MRVEIDDKSGFCFGVVNAISKAEESIGNGQKVYSLGDIVHNRVEVQRLEQLGLETMQHKELSNLHNATILIRAHGEPPSTYLYAEANGLRVIDATCSVVARLQRLVEHAHKMMEPVAGQVVILGKRGHAEVVGLTGQVAEDAIVVEGIDDLHLIDFERPIYLLSQTTQSLALFKQVSGEILNRATKPENVVVNDTICRQVANREPHLREFAARYSVIIFVCGRKSSNGKVLFDVCRGQNPHSHTVEDEHELQKEWFTGAESVGICGATSTPKWLMTRVAERIKSAF